MFCTIVAALLCGVLWGGGVFLFATSPSYACEVPTSVPAEGENVIVYTLTHFLTSDKFDVASLVISAALFVFFYYQLFQHEKYAQMIAEEDLVDTTGAVDAPETIFGALEHFVYSTHGILTLTNSFVVVAMSGLALLGMSAIDMAMTDRLSTCRQLLPATIYILILDLFVALCFLVSVCVRCICRLVTDAEVHVNSLAELNGLKPMTRINGDVSSGEYTAVNKSDAADIDADELFSGGDGGNEGNSLSAENDQELMDMLDKKKSKTSDKAAAALSAVATRVGKLLPSVKRSNGSAAENTSLTAEDDQEYDYGDIDVEEDEANKK